MCLFVQIFNKTKLHLKSSLLAFSSASFYIRSITVNIIIYNNDTRTSFLNYIITLGKPGTPTLNEAGVQKNVGLVRWQPSYDGGSNQTFEVWGRMGDEDDFSWKVIGDVKGKLVGESRKKNFMLSNMFSKMAEEKMKLTYFFSVRATNERGSSGFSKVAKVVVLPSEKDKFVGGTINKYIVGKTCYIKLIFHSKLLNTHFFVAV